MFEVNSVFFSIRGYNPFERIGLSLGAGEMASLTGRNGAGKSTFFKILTGLIKCPAYVAYNHSFIQPSLRSSVIGYMPQESFLPKSITLKAIVGCFDLERESKEIMLEHPLMLTSLNKRVGLLSFGQIRTIELLLVVSSKCNVILLDEPFEGIDPIVADHLVNYIKSYASRGKTFVIIDHKDTMCALCKKTISLV